MAAGAPLSLRYHSDQLNNKVLGLLREFYLTGEFCDVVLHIGSIRINAHRIVLAAFSPYFRDLFHQPSSKNSREITLQNHLKEDAVRQLVDFCYSSDITVDSQSADKILAAANFLQIKEVEKLCITFLAAQQALKSEQANQPHVSQVLVPTSVPARSPPEAHQKGDNSRELACADTSGIGSNHTSPRHSSRPSSVPSGNGSMQPLEDTDLDMVEIKKEHDDLPLSDQPFFTPPSSGSWIKPDYESLRTSMAAGFPRFFFPTVTGALSLPTTPSHHQLLMKALTQSSTSPSDLRDFGELYMGKLAGSSHLKDESPSQNSAEDGGYSDSSQAHQCHICLKLFQGLASLKAHMTEHQDTLTVPSASTYKMMSPVRKLSTPSLSQAQSPGKTDGEDYSGSNMCGTCGKTFRDPQSLKFHRYNHVLRYQCNYCGKRFSRSWNLHRHRKTHYRQVQDSSLGSEDVTVIDVDNVKSESSSYSLDKDKILTSPYADYRNHRHDMMPFAFDMRRMPGSSSFNGEDDREEKGEENQKDGEMMAFAFDMRRMAGAGGYRHEEEEEEEDKGKSGEPGERDSDTEQAYQAIKGSRKDSNMETEDGESTSSEKTEKSHAK